jgi:hypothetical protein
MPKIVLSCGEIQSYSSDIYEILSNIPLFYLYEILELAQEGRQRDGEVYELDISDSEEEENNEEYNTETDED